MSKFEVGSRVKLVNLIIWDSVGTEYKTSKSNTIGNTGTVYRINDDGDIMFVEWDNGSKNIYSLYNLELIMEITPICKDVYTIALNSLEEAGIKVSRQTLKCVAYHVVFGELLFEVMRKEKLDLQTTGAIIAALNKAITEE